MKKLDVNKMYEWPIATRCLVIALICIVVFYLGYKFDIASEIKRLQIARNSEADTKLQYEAIIRKQADAKKELIRLNKIRTLLTEWQRNLVQYDQLPELLNQILKVGNNNNVYFSLFDPGEVETDNHYEKLPIKIIAAGNYHQLADFISQIANLPWIVSISDFAITSDNQSDVLGAKLAETATSQNLLTLTMMLDIYYKPVSGTSDAKPADQTEPASDSTNTTGGEPHAN